MIRNQLSITGIWSYCTGCNIPGHRAARKAVDEKFGQMKVDKVGFITNCMRWLYSNEANWETRPMIVVERHRHFGPATCIEEVVQLETVL